MASETAGFYAPCVEHVIISNRLVTRISREEAQRLLDANEIYRCMADHVDIEPSVAVFHRGERPS